MIADFFTKPLQGRLFHYLKAIIMAQEPLTKLTTQFMTQSQERVCKNAQGHSSVSVSHETEELKDTKEKSTVPDALEHGVFRSDVDRKKETSYADIVRGVNTDHSLFGFYPKVKN